MGIVNRLFVGALVFAIAGFWTPAADGAEQLKRKLVAAKVVDLTHKMHDEMAYWPGGVPFKKTVLVDYRQGYLLHKFEMGENTGTHVDKYQIENLANLDELPPTGATVFVGVLPVRGGSQAQARVVAFLP